MPILITCSKIRVNEYERGNIKMEGTVKWFNNKKGFGFIIGDDGAEYFIHHSALAQGTFIRDNDKVSFDPVDSDKGKQAQNVSLLQKASDMAAEAEGSEEAPAEESAQEEAPAEEAEEPAAEEAPEEADEEEKKEE